MSKRDPRVNRYRSSKNPHQEVIVAQLPGGGQSVAVIDWAHGRINQAKVGVPEEEAEEGETKI